MSRVTENLDLQRGFEAAIPDPGGSTPSRRETANGYSPVRLSSGRTFRTRPLVSPTPSIGLAPRSNQVWPG